MKDHGVTPINWTTVVAELQRDWRLPTGQEVGRTFHDHYQSYGPSMDSFEAVTVHAVRKVSWRPRIVPDESGATDLTPEIERSEASKP